MVSYITSNLGATVTSWLDSNVEPVGSAVIVDKALEVEGAAADAKITGLLAKNIPFYNYIELFDPKHNNINSRLNFTVNDDGSVSVQGTSTQVEWLEYIPLSTDNFPSVLQKNVRYQINLYNNHNDRLSLRIYYYHDNGQLNLLAATPNNKYFTIPSSATGLLIRLHINNPNTDEYINETVYPVFCKEYPFYSPNVPIAHINTPYTDADDILENSIYFVSRIGGVPRIDNIPINRAGFLCTYILTNSNLACQIYYPYDLMAYNNVKFRTKLLSGEWSTWYDLVDTRSISQVNPTHIWANSNILQNRTFEKNGITFTWLDNITCKVEGVATRTSLFNFLEGNSPEIASLIAGKTINVFFESEEIQFDLFYYHNNTLDSTYIIKHTTSFNDSLKVPSDVTGILCRFWYDNQTVYDETVTVNITVNGKINLGLEKDLNNFKNTITTPSASNNNLYYYGSLVDVEDLNDLIFTSSYFISSPTTINNIPYAPCWLNTIRTSDSIVFQIAYPYHNTDFIKIRSKTFQGWTEWRTVAGDGSNGEATYNTYNITTSPHITTDTNGWLQAIDTNTKSESGKTDMTGPIMSMLQDTGYCHLGEGIFYVSGNIDMPEGSTLEGCGNKTIIRLLKTVTDGYCVRIGRYNTIQNIKFSGGYGEGTTAVVADSTIGKRNGIIYISDTDSSPRTMPNVMPCIISGCWFENFDGSALYSHSSGGGVQESLLITNCYMQYCKAGINLDHRTEYHKITNVVTYRCYWACINNGGNNTFTNCTFHGTVGFLIDNSQNQSNNNAHGSVIGCTFNHIDNWNNPSVLGMGTAIKILNAQNGYIFTGCQLWYGGIDIQNSRGIVLSDCLIGGNHPSIKITGKYFNSLQNCIFHATPSTTLSDKAIFVNCYLDSTGELITG